VDAFLARAIQLAEKMLWLRMAHRFLKIHPGKARGIVMIKKALHDFRDY
jgi:hypothetical protein